MGQVPVDFRFQLAEGDFRVDHHRLHVGERFQIVIEVDRVEYTKRFFADLITLSGGTTFHLLIQNSAFNGAQKDQITNLRDVDSGGKQVYSDGYTR